MEPLKPTKIMEQLERFQSWNDGTVAVMERTKNKHGNMEPLAVMETNEKYWNDGRFYNHGLEPTENHGTMERLLS